MASSALLRFLGEGEGPAEKKDKFLEQNLLFYSSHFFNSFRKSNQLVGYLKLAKRVERSEIKARSLRNIFVKRDFIPY